MATLTVWRFDSSGAAERAATIARDLSTRQQIVLYDAATVTWEVGKKKPETHQLNNPTRAGALNGAFWGVLFGMIFFVPLVGAALGAATGALSGSLNDVGIDDGFINRVRDQVTPGTSALFVMSSDAVMDKGRDAFAGHQPSDLIFTNLSDEQEAALREVFAQD